MVQKKEISPNNAELKVAEAQQDDVNKGIVRIDTELMKNLGVRQGDIIEIEGTKKSAAIVGRAFPADMGLLIIRMDGLTRRNCGTSIGERVNISKADVKPAKKLIIAPAQKNIHIKGQFEGLVNTLLGRAVTKGDIISLGGTRRRRRAFMGGPFEEIFNQLMGDDFAPGLGFGFLDIKFMVVSTNPKDSSVLITEETAIEVKPEAVEIQEETLPTVTYEDIGGLEDEVKKVREMIELPLKHPELFERLGVKPPKGVLLYGPPGTGKTLLAKAVAAESSAHFMSINGPEIMSKFVGEAEKKLRTLFEDAEKSAPSIIFIDEIDAIAPKRDESYGEVERRVVAQLLALMDGLKSRGKVIVIAATNRANALDPALRRGGRFDREIDIGVPDKKGRLNILKIHTRNMPLEKDVDLNELADVTHGFVGADLEGLAKEAAMTVLRRVLPDFNVKEETKLPTELLEKLIVTKSDFKEALKFVRPSAMRELLIEKPKIKWDDIGGLEKAKQEIKESIEWPLKKPEIFKNLGIRPPRGILLYGPPGTGKTLLAKAVATESDANFISVKGPEVMSKWVGESEKSVREIFNKARQVSPSIIFFDEFDALAPRRGGEDGARVGEKVVNQILTEMDGLEELTDVVVMAATNRPELIDSALLRPGRFDRWILVPPPSETERLEILKVHTKNVPLAKGISLEEINKKLIGYSGADIESVVREAAMIALRENMDAKEVKKKHFADAMKRVSPSLSKEDADKYKQILDAVKSAPKTVPDYLG